ncbi:MAG: VWA domain-containing protein [Pseudomonadota bacterium]
MAEDQGPGETDRTAAALVAFDRPITEQYERLAALLAAELSPDDAALLGRPPPPGGFWASADGRPLRPIAELAAAERDRLAGEHTARRARIVDLADRMEARGEAGRVAAHALRTALVTPTGVDALQTDGTRAVLAPWGMAMPGQPRPLFVERAVPDVPPAAPIAAGPPAADPPNAAAAVYGPSEGTEARATASPPRLVFLAWALPLALLAVALWLAVELARPLEPVIVALPAPPTPPLVDPTIAAGQRVDALEAALAAAEAAERRVLAACVAPPPPPPAVVPSEPGAADAPPPANRPALPPVRGAPPGLADAVPTLRPDVVPPPRATTTVVDPPTAAQSTPTAPPSAAAPPSQAARPPAPAASVCNPGWPPGRRPRVIFVVDGSGSMAEPLPGAASRMSGAKRAIGDVTGNLHRDIEVGMVSFSDCSATQRSRFYSYGQRGAFLGRVNGLAPQRQTSLARSIARGGATAPRRGDVVMVVVTDGADTCGGDPCGAARAAMASKPNLRINVVDLSGGRGGAGLSCIAQAGRGRVFTPASAGQMNAQLQRATGQGDASGCP